MPVPYPYDDPLAQIGGFAGGNLADQLRRRRAAGPPPVNPTGVPLPAPAEQRPRTVTPGYQSDQSDALYDDAAEQWTAARSGQPMAAPPTASRPQLQPPQQPRMPALNLPELGEPVAGGPLPTEAGDNNPPLYRQPMKEYTDARGLNSVGRKLAEIEALRKAGPDQDVVVGDDGKIQTSHPHKRGRGKQALLGGLYGALEGAKVAGWKGAIGGAGVGALSGAVSPNLIAALTRDMDIQRKQGVVDTELATQAKQGQLAVQQSQIAENQAQAARTASKPDDYTTDADGNQLAVYGTDARPVTRNGEPVVGKDPDAETEAQRNARADAMTRHKERLAAAEAKRKADDAKLVDVEVGGRKYRVSQSAAANIRVRQQQNAKKPSPGRESAIEAVIENEAERNALDRRRDTDTEIARLRGEREQLTHRSVQKPDGSWGWEENIVAVERNKQAVAQLDKAIADLQKESDNQQRIAEAAAAKKRTAEAKARAGGEKVEWSGNVSRAKFRAKYPDYAKRSDAEVDAAIEASGYRPIP